jgi:AcrR family transcriptional regulator
MAARTILEHQTELDLDLSQVASAAGVSRGGLYRYFDGANAILEELLSRHIQQVRGRFQAEIAAVPPDLDRAALVQRIICVALLALRSRPPGIPDPVYRGFLRRHQPDQSQAAWLAHELAWRLAGSERRTAVEARLADYLKEVQRCVHSIALERPTLVSDPDLAALLTAELLEVVAEAEMGVAPREMSGGEGGPPWRRMRRAHDGA